MLRTDSMVTPCPDRFHTRCELFFIGLCLRPCQSAPWRPLSSSTSSAVRQALSEVRAADSGEGQRGRWALALSTGPYNKKTHSTARRR
eukprot:scaffold11462_cov68-Phaeocystis_antarctica.AAC.3